MHDIADTNCIMYTTLIVYGIPKFLLVRESHLYALGPWDSPNKPYDIEHCYTRIAMMQAAHQGLKLPCPAQPWHNPQGHKWPTGIAHKSYTKGVKDFNCWKVYKFENQ